MFQVGDITSANATLVLTVDQLFPAGIPLMQFATDQSFAPNEATWAETRMGVDGGLVAGWVPNPKEVNIMLEASSPSYMALAQYYRACERKRGFYTCSIVCVIPSIIKTITWSTGLCVGGTPVPAGKKILDPTTWKFVFKDMTIVG